MRPIGQCGSNAKHMLMNTTLLTWKHVGLSRGETSNYRDEDLFSEDIMRNLFFFYLLCGCTVEVPLRAVWLEPPVIEICIEEQRDLIIESLDWWKSISDEYEVLTIRSSDCETAAGYGIIRFTLAEEEYLVANNYVAYTGTIFSIEDLYEDPYHGWLREQLIAVVYLRKGASKNTVRHELGHAWGWQHTERLFHLMSPYGGTGIVELDTYPDSMD